MMDDLKDTIETNHQLMIHPTIYELMIPSEIGFVSYFTNGNFYTFSGRGKYSFDADKTSLSFKIRNNLHMVHERMAEFGVNDPLKKSWVGVVKRGRSNVHIPISADVVLDFRELKLKLTLNRLEEGETFGFNFHEGTGTYFYSADFKTALHKSCPNCDYYLPVSRGPNTRKSLMLLHHECEASGRHLKLKVYDCERKVNYRKGITLMKEFFSGKSMSNIESLPFKILAGTKNMINYLLHAPTTGNCGIMFINYEGDTHTPTSMELSLSFMEKPKFGIYLLDEYDIKIKSSLSFIDANQKVLRRWDIENHLTSSVEELQSHIHINAVRSVNDEKNLQFCLDLIKNSSSALEVGYTNFEPINDSVTKIIKFSAGAPLADSCPSDGPKISLTRVGTVTDEQKKMILDDHWGCIKQKDVDKWGDSVPETDECHAAILEGMTARHYLLNLTVENSPVTTRFIDLYLKALKAIYFPYYVPSIDSGKTNEGHYDLEVQYSATDREAQFTSYNPYEVMKFENVPSYFEEIKLEYIRNPELAVLLYKLAFRFCPITVKDIRTFDKYHQEHEFGDKWVLATGLKPGLAVFVTKEGPAMMAVKIFYHAAEIEINSKGMFLNGNHIEDSALEQIIHHKTDDGLVFRLWKSSAERNVFIKSFPLLIRRTHHAVVLETLAIQRYETLGICGNLNDNPNDDDHTVYTL